LSRPTLFIVDGSSYIYRAYHAIRPLFTSTGIPTNAVYGFTTMLLKLLREWQPTYLVVAFDHPAPSFRKAMFEAYKATRPPTPDDLVPQLKLVREVARAFNIPQVEVEGFEADDVIATLTARARDHADVTIVSTDKDLMQLVDERVRLLDTMRDKVFGPAEVREKYGVEPAQMIEVLGLMGDSSDNIPGVPGIGEKTAAQLIREHGTIEGVLARVDEVAGEKRRQSLREHAEQARLSRRLAIVRTDVPLPFDLEALRVRPPDREQLAEVLSRLEFHSLMKEMEIAQPVKPSAIDRDRYRTVLTEADLARVVESLRRAGSFAVDTETTSLDPMRAVLVGISLCWAPGEACYIPLDHRYLGAPPQLGRERVLSALRPLLEDPALPKTGQNIKYDWVVLRRAGVTIGPIAMDSMVAAYLLDPGKPSYRLEELAREYLGHQMLTYAEVTGRGKAQIAFEEVDVETATRYSGEDAEVAYLLGRLLEPKIREAGLERLFREVELPLLRVLASMEMHGVKVDRAILADLSRRFEEMALGAERRIHELAGMTFNVNSPKQLQEVLFNGLGLKPLKRTQTGFSTDGDVLEELAREHPLAREILEYRSVTKLKSTYVDALPALVNPQTGGRHGEAFLLGPQPAEHPGADRARARDPAGVRGGGGEPAPLRRLLPDRAPDPGPPLRRRHADGRLPQGGGHPRPNGGGGVWRRPPRRDFGDANQREGDQLWYHLRDGRLPAGAGAGDPPEAGPVVHRELLRPASRGEAVPLRDARGGAQGGGGAHAPRAEAVPSRSPLPEPQPARSGRADRGEYSDPGERGRPDQGGDGPDPARPGGGRVPGPDDPPGPRRAGLRGP